MAQATKSKKKTRTYEAMLTEYQEAIDATVLILAELRSSPSLTSKQKSKINRTIDDLQKTSRGLPQLTDSPDQISKVFVPVKKAIKLWEALFRS